MTRLVPWLTVIGRSVFSRRVRQGTPSAVVSSWIPPRGLAGPLAVPEQRVDHHVPDEMNPIAPDPFLHEILVGCPLGGEEQIGDRVSENPVDLFRHASIKAPEPRLHVSQPEAELGRRECPCQRGVHVADHDDQVRLSFGQHGFEAQHDLGDLGRGARGFHLEVHVRVRQLEVGEEGVGHGTVVVLARVDQRGDHVRPRAQVGHDGSDFHEVGPGAHDGRDLHRVSLAVRTPPWVRISRTGANRKSLSKQRSLASVVWVLTEWRIWVSQPTRILGWWTSSSHGCR